MANISKIKLGLNVYDIADTAARADIANINSSLSNFVTQSDISNFATSSDISSAVSASEATTNGRIDGITQDITGINNNISNINTEIDNMNDRIDSLSNSGELLETIQKIESEIQDPQNGGILGSFLDTVQQAMNEGTVQDTNTTYTFDVSESTGILSISENQSTTNYTVWKPADNSEH